MTFDLLRGTSSGQNMETGYDCEFVDGPPKELHWECSICLLVLRQPYLVDCCGNHFCKACLERVSEANEIKGCPLCKQEKFTFIPNKGLERVLNQRKVYCSNKKSGCEWTGELRQLDSHLNDQSSSKGGASAVSANDQPSSPTGDTDPLLEGCQFVEVCCCNCPTTVLRSQMKKHLNVCPNKPVKCKYCKNFTAIPKDLEENHHPVCPKFPLPCPNKCGAEIQRKNVAKHVDTTCPLSKLPCEYSHVGCAHVSTRKKMEGHVKSASGMAAHLSLMEKAYAALKLSKSEETDNRELALRVKSLEQHIAALQDDHFLEVQYFSDQNVTLEEKVQGLSAEMHRLDAENRRLRAKLNDYYKFSGNDDVDHASSSSVAEHTPRYHHSSYSSEASYSRYPTSSTLYKSPPKSTSSRVKPKLKQSDSDQDSGIGWGTALGALGLGIAGGVAGALALASQSSSSDEKRKSKKDSWY